MISNIFNRIAMFSLKKNKIRTASTIIGIILAVSLITMISSIVVSGQGFLENMIGDMEGTWHVKAVTPTITEAQSMVGHEEIQDYGLCQDIGFSKIENTVDENRKYLYISGINDGYSKVMPVEVIDGRLPENTNEIMLPEHFVSDTRQEYKVGDVITLQVGRRIDEDGNDLGINYGYSEGETLKESFSKEYSIVGISKELSTELGSAPLWYEACTGIDNNLKENTEYQCYIKLKKPSEVYNFIDKYIKNAGYGWNDNTDYLGVIGVGEVTAQQISLYIVGTVLILFIVIGSVCLINNAFAISINERIKQFGLLSSVGGTPKQLRKMIFFEAIVVCIIGIPVGIIIGVIMTRLLVHFWGGWIGGLFSLSKPFKLEVSGITIVIAALNSFLTVIISAALPARSIKAISPMEAINNITDEKISRKKVKTSSMIYKLWGLEGMLASKEYKKNKKRYKSVITSLTLSVLFFVGISTVGAYVEAIAKNYYPSTNSDIYVYSDNLKDIDEENSLYTVLGNQSGVEDSGYHISYGVEMLLGEYELSSGVYQALNYEQQLTSDKRFCTVAGLQFIPDEDFNEYAEKMNLTAEEFYNKEEIKAIAYDTVNYTKYNPMRTAKGSFLNHDMNTIQLNSYKFRNDIYEEDPAGEFNKKPLSIEIGAFAKELPISSDTGIKSYGSHLSIIMPEAMRYIIEDSYSLTPSVVMGFKVEDHKKAFIDMEKIIKDNYKDVIIKDYAETYGISRGMITFINFASYLFIIIFMAISIANIINTMVTSVGLRKREFAILQSVGMSDKGLDKMMNLECLIYASKAVTYGTILSIIVNIFIYLFVARLFDIGFLFPLGHYLISVLCVFVSIFGIMHLIMRKVKAANVIEGVRNENI